ncbi:MAG: stage III sporulation protein AA [Lachnospiraceae bacterium]
MEVREQIIRMFTGNLRKLMAELPIDFERLQEIHLRAGKPLLLLYEHREIFVGKNGGISDRRNAVRIVTAEEIRDTFSAVCGYSVYAFGEEVKRGYLSVSGGHRIGITGSAVLEQGKVSTLKNLSGMNIRISHDVKDCAAPWKRWMYQEHQPLHMLFVSPPGCGKTTFLRDTIRLYSDGTGTEAGVNVGVADERSEIGGSYLGIPTHDLGIRTDLLDGCPKAEGMQMLLRSMSPRVLAADEIGSREDVEAIEEAIRSGCKILATVHGETMEELRNKPGLEKLLRECVFERYFFLKKGQTPGVVARIYDRQQQILWEEAACT